MSFLNGLSAAGAGIAQFAGSAGLELQKSQLAQQQAVLADQLATTRETTLQGQAQTFQAGQTDKAQQFQTGLEAQRQTFQAGQTDRELAVRTSEGAATRAAEFARTQMTLGADAPEIKSAKQFSQLPPDQKKAYREEIMLKAGLPPWMMGDDTSGGAQPSAPPSDSGAGSPAVTGGADTSPTDTTATPSRPGLNDKALAKLPPTAQSLVKGMVDGRISPPNSFAASKPYWQNLIQMATTYDPTFDETSWQGRVATRKDFASGKSAQAVTALNTALGHAGVVDESLTSLNNGSVPVVNALANWTLDATGSARPTNAKMAIDALASEARKVFAGSGGGNLHELEEWQKNFPINGSPDQQKGAMRQFTNLLDSRLDALSDQYNRGMGKTDDPLNMLQPHAREVYERLTGRDPSNATGYQTGKPPAASAPAAPAPAPSAAIPSWVKPGDQYSPSRGQARGADGTVYGPQ